MQLQTFHHNHKTAYASHAGLQFTSFSYLTVLIFYSAFVSNVDLRQSILHTNRWKQKRRQKRENARICVCMPQNNEKWFLLIKQTAKAISVRHPYSMDLNGSHHHCYCRQTMHSCHGHILKRSHFTGVSSPFLMPSRETPSHIAKIEYSNDRRTAWKKHWKKHWALYRVRKKSLTSIEHVNTKPWSAICSTRVICIKSLLFVCLSNGSLPQ